ncbi:hypothetical protein CRE_17890 [Caenorhabditis remanei]|uniref:F-box associated domain-containing protein n=1 Tax=Caenorhabditis remanei TaxID=31234 RepID=E3MDE0_CAERE|nr:hypothetical protein CRE_17890 [Caenorhabditis remanei]
MPPALSYPALRCISENLEAVKRMHIACRSPSFGRIDKSIPINMNSVIVDCQSVTFNNLTVEFYYNDQLLFRYQNDRQKTVMQRIPETMTPFKSIDRFFDYFLKGRKIINVDFLTARYIPGYLIPPVFRINQLETILASFTDYLPIVDSCSFPLKRLSTPIDEVEIFTHPVFCSAKSLRFTVFENEVIGLNDINKLICKNVEFGSNSLLKMDIVELIRYWEKNGKEIGTRYIFSQDYDGHIEDEISGLKTKFDGFIDDLEGINERFLPSSPRFSIPINSKSRICLYGIETDSIDRSQLIISVMPTNSGKETSALITDYSSCNTSDL